MDLSALHLPVQHKSRPDEDFFPSSTTWTEDIEINGRSISTDFCVTVLEKKVLVLISQCGTVGSWVEASVDTEPGLAEDIGGMAGESLTYDTMPLFGTSAAHAEVYRVYARKLIQLFHEKNPAFDSMMLGIALKDTSPEMFKKIVASVGERL